MINSRPSIQLRSVASLALPLLALAFAPQVFAADGNAARCAARLEVAQRLDMESFRDFDADTFRAGHDERAVTVFASGARRIGVDAIMTALASHFANRNAVWSWTEL